MKAKQKVTPRRVAFSSNESLNKLESRSAELQSSIEECSSHQSNHTNEHHSESVTKRPLTDEYQISGDSNEDESQEDLREEEEQEYSLKVKKHGFQRPFHSWQIMSWVFYLLPLGLFYSFIITQLEYKAIWCVLVAILDGLVLIFGVITTKIDPTDPTVYQTRQIVMKKEKHSIPQNTEMCSNCQAYSLVSSKHCGQCNRCVSGFDHHCKWLNNCIGDANYKLFFILIVWVFLLSTLKFIATLTGIVRYYSQREMFESNVMKVGLIIHSQFYGLQSNPSNLNLAIVVIEIILLPLEVLIIVGSVQLIIYHICLKCKGLTTYEYLMRKRNLRQKILHPSQELEVRKKITNYYPDIQINNLAFHQIIEMVDADPKLKALIFKSRAKSKKGKKKKALAGQNLAQDSFPQTYQLNFYNRETMREVSMQGQTREQVEAAFSKREDNVNEIGTKTPGYFQNLQHPGINRQELQFQSPPKEMTEKSKNQENGEGLLFVKSGLSEEANQPVSETRYKAPLNDSSHTLLKQTNLLYSPVNQVDHNANFLQTEYGQSFPKTLREQESKSSRVLLNAPTHLQKKKLKLDRMQSLSPTFNKPICLTQTGVRISSALSARQKLKKNSNLLKQEV